MAGIITTASHPKALWPGIKAWWGQVYDEHAEEYSDLFDKDSSDKNYEEDVQLTGFGLAPRKSEGQATQFDSEVQGFTTRFTHVAYALGYVVTKEELDDNLYEQVSKRRAAALAMSFRQTKENVAANIYNRAFTAGYLGGDGVPLCSSSHPNTNGGTWANQPAVAVDLSEAALEDAIVALMGYQNDRGLLINVMPKTLHIARQEVFNAQRILQSSYSPGTANNDLNIIKTGNYLPGGFKVNHYFTSPRAWFIRTNVANGMKYYERKSIEFDQDNDFDTSNAKAKGYERYSFGWTDPRAVYGVNGP
jgi:hypothetical protein